MSLTKTGKSGQKFIARNRSPRVQIEYDVEIYGSEKKGQIPFVMGVLADLSGKPVDPLPEIADRKFLEIDIDNFDARMKSIKPRVAFQVDNTLTGEGKLNIDRSEEHTSELQSPCNLVCRLLLEKKKKNKTHTTTGATFPMPYHHFRYHRQ